MISLTQYIKEGSTKLVWKKEYDGQDSSGRKIYKHVSKNGRYEIALSGMDSMKKNKDGSQKYYLLSLIKQSLAEKFLVIRLLHIGM